MSVRSTRPPTYYEVDYCHLKRSNSDFFVDTESIPTYNKENIDKPDYDGRERLVFTEEKGRQVNKIGTSTKAIKVRWLMVAVHLVLTLATFIIYMITIGTFIPIIVFGTLVLGMLAYIPAMSVLDAKNKSSRFQAAGLEVGYLAVQQLDGSRQLSWLSGILYRNNNSNSIHGSLFDNASVPGWAAWLTVALCSIHFCLLLGWMIWIIKVTKRNGGAWSLGVNHLLRL